MRLLLEERARKFTGQKAEVNSHSMKKIGLNLTGSLLTASLVASSIACGTAENAATTNNATTNNATTTNANPEVARSSSQPQPNAEVLPGGFGIRRAGQGNAPKSPDATENSAPRAPGGTPIDTSADDAEIKRLEGIVGKRKADAQARLELARAYATRASRLTQAAQYRSALGDWRRATTLDPSNTEAQNMIATITSIFQQLNREPPAPGEEPPPLPFNK